MNYKNNLDFTEVFVRYTILMALVIFAGAIRQYWLVIPANMILLSAILGWDPVKQYFSDKKEKRSVVKARLHHKSMAA